MIQSTKTLLLYHCIIILFYYKAAFVAELLYCIGLWGVPVILSNPLLQFSNINTHPLTRWNATGTISLSFQINSDCWPWPTAAGERDAGKTEQTLENSEDTPPRCITSTATACSGTHRSAHTGANVMAAVVFTLLPIGRIQHSALVSLFISACEKQHGVISPLYILIWGDKPSVAKCSMKLFVHFIQGCVTCTILPALFLAHLSQARKDSEGRF